jgi:hypothetical protein
LELGGKVDAVLGAQLHEEFAALVIYEFDMDRAGPGMVGQGFF